MPIVRKQLDAKVNKNDEFYTLYETIEKELVAYGEHFKDKIVYCNCDDHLESNFSKYFIDNFINLGLKKLICTTYNPNENGRGTLYIYDGIIPYVSQLNSNGGYEKDDCIELLKKSDIVVTNPPFSKFRNFIQTIVENGKDFIVVGTVTAVTYSDIFELYMCGKIKLGHSIKSGDITFQVPDKYPLNSKNGFIENGKKYLKVTGIRWWTNLNHGKINYFLEMDSLSKNKSDKCKYLKYYNYDAINIDNSKLIPYDYSGVMGVPITFIDKINFEQFEVIGLGRGKNGLDIGTKPIEQEHLKQYKTKGKGGVSYGTLYFVDDLGDVTVPYSRLLIRHKLQYDGDGNPII